MNTYTSAVKKTIKNNWRVHENVVFLTGTILHINNLFPTQVF